MLPGPDNGIHRAQQGHPGSPEDPRDQLPEGHRDHPHHDEDHGQHPQRFAQRREKTPCRLARGTRTESDTPFQTYRGAQETKHHQCPVCVGERRACDRRGKIGAQKRSKGPGQGGKASTYQQEEPGPWERNRMPCPAGAVYCIKIFHFSCPLSFPWLPSAVRYLASSSPPTPISWSTICLNCCARRVSAREPSSLRTTGRPASPVTRIL